ncbi:MAG: hypothetical protein IJM59_03910, partial [Proteobacteria bacterium]|nr:hypothetical protein [Pseudomonadota bacterium]
GCTQSSGYATCSAVSLNTDINAECDPVKVDNRYFGYLLSTHLFPILRQVAGLRSMQSSQDGLTKVSKLLKSPELQNNLLSKDNKGKKKLTTYLANPLSENNPTGKKCEDECADAMVASLFYASIAECMNNKTDHCPDGMQLTVEGADSSQSKSETYYKMLREIAKHLIATDSGKNNDNPKSVTEDDIDKFLIDQVIYINNATANLSGLMSNSQELVNIQQYLFAHPEDPTSVEPRLEGGKVYLKPTHFSHATAKAVTTALKSFLAGAYGRIEDEARYEAHRKFFAHFILRSMSNADKSNLFSLTFVQRKQCQDVTSPAGRDTGYMQYCYSEDFSDGLGNQSVAELFTKLIPEGIKGEDAAAALADGIIMDTSFSTELKINNSDKTIALDLSDESGNNVLTIAGDDIKGKWKSYRCAMGASCNTDSECGVCTNSNVKITRVDATGQKHDNATCVAGDLVYPQSGGNAPDPVQETPCEDGTIGCITEGGFSFLAQCENGTYLKDDNMYFYHKCFNGCNETRDGCMNDYSCSTEEIGKVKCFFDYRFGQLATVLGECKKGEDGTTKYDIIPSSIAGCANKACNKEMTACVDPMGESKPEDNKCTEGDVKCIKDKDKAYLATCNGSEYKYDDSNACISNDCNDDNTNCYYDTTCTESDVGQTQCVYLNSQYGPGTVEMTCTKADNAYVYTPLGADGKPKICLKGCSEDRSTCK